MNNASFVKFFFEKYAQIMHFYNILKNSFLEIFENSPASGGLRPRTLSEAGHKLESPKVFPAYATGSMMLKNGKTKISNSNLNTSCNSWFNAIIRIPPDDMTIVGKQ